MELEYKKQFLINAIYYAILVLLFMLSFKFVFSYLLPVIVAFIVATFVQKPSFKIAKTTHLPQPVCAFLGVVITFISVALLSWFLVYIFIVFLRSFSGDFTSITEKIKRFTDEIGKINTDFFYKISPEISVFVFFAEARFT